MKNVAAKIAQHNFKVLNKASEQSQPGCTCRDKLDCPLDGQCKTESLVYQATLASDQDRWNYFGLTENSFKKRYSGHKQSFAKRDIEGTTLSSKVWELKDARRETDVKFKLAHRAHAYTAGMKVCDLCLTEKTRILLGHDGPSKIPKTTGLLNRRTEILQKCRHRLKYTLTGMHRRKFKFKD